MTRCFELVTDQEWNRVNQKLEYHKDISDVMLYLVDGFGEGIRTVKIPCSQGQSHKKRMAAREQGNARGFKIKTKWAEGWLYIRRES